MSRYYFDPPDDADRYDIDPRTRTFTRKGMDDLKAHANPQCLVCEGEGFYSIGWNGDPDRVEDVTCACVDPCAAWRQPDEDTAA